MAEVVGTEGDFLSSQEDDLLASPPSKEPPTSLPVKDTAGSKHKRQKIKTAELEEIHAASQRLLRESPSASFKPVLSSGKFVTSVLEKIRLRKRQLVQGRSAFSVLPNITDSLDIVDQEISITKSTNLEPLSHQAEIFSKADIVARISSCEDANDGVGADENVTSILKRRVGVDVDPSSTPKDYSEDRDSDDFGKSPTFGSGNPFRPPMEDTQDLLSSDDELDGNPDLDRDNEDFGGSRVALQLDTETQDDYAECLGVGLCRDNTESNSAGDFPSKKIFKGPSVRALIDDEAEDEDEDALLPAEDEEGDEGEDVVGLIVKEIQEEARDRVKRAELHSKWLEQQDDVMTDDILLRLKTGWKPRDSRKRGFDIFDDDHDLFTREHDENVESSDEEEDIHESQELPDDSSLGEEDLKDDVQPDERRVVRPFEDPSEVYESSDDEEAEQRMMRQRFLEESDAQRSFVPPAEDETSREIFGLISKVNVASANKKPKNGSVTQFRSLCGGSSNSNSSFTAKSSFLRRTASSNFASVQRHGSNGGSATRSFIFGRDDSNSSHSFDQHGELSNMKENIAPATQSTMKAAPIGRFGQKNDGKATKTSVSPLGPSLFEILRRQSTEMDNLMQKKGLNGGSPMPPMLAAFKTIKTNTPKTAHRA
ncbi:hypothetical protein KP509_32G007200 [Ceratopteris richardii]|uniref:Uncharacterized protein n=1 Tax=Ceratopteris richardii TaxID=49495 RepID=A0A8T2QR35_CERRI|nr:hypothetical protein KP509_32G007200 [Ceratopteris richardii]